MLQQLRERASEALATARQVLLSSYGPAEIQVEIVACEARGLALYVLVPRASDLLFNLENNTLVVATADSWQMRGEARLLVLADYLDLLALARTPAAAWSQIVEIRPTQLQLHSTNGHGQGETIDIW